MHQCYKCFNHCQSFEDYPKENLTLCCVCAQDWDEIDPPCSLCKDQLSRINIQDQLKLAHITMVKRELVLNPINAEEILGKCLYKIALQLFAFH